MEKSILKEDLGEIALNNIVNKLHIYMDKSKQSLHKFAENMGFSYQPFYRLIMKKHMPMLSSLTLIASYLDCTIAELVQDEIFLDINLYKNLEESMNASDIIDKFRIYIPYKLYLPLIHNEFFAVKSDNSLTNLHKIFYTVDEISSEGSFLINSNSKRTLIEVVGLGRKSLTIIKDNKEHKIDKDLIKPVAAYFSDLELIEKANPKIFGIRL